MRRSGVGGKLSQESKISVEKDKDLVVGRVSGHPQAGTSSAPLHGTHSEDTVTALPKKPSGVSGAAAHKHGSLSPDAEDSSTPEQGGNHSTISKR